MISQSPFSEYDETLRRMSDKRIRDIYGMSPELFYELPYDIQQALILSTHEELMSREQKESKKGSYSARFDNFLKKMALSQYEFEESVKVKVMSIFKRSK